MPAEWTRLGPCSDFVAYSVVKTVAAQTCQWRRRTSLLRYPSDTSDTVADTANSTKQNHKCTRRDCTSRAADSWQRNKSRTASDSRGQPSSSLNRHGQGVDGDGVDYGDCYYYRCPVGSSRRAGREHHNGPPIDPVDGGPRPIYWRPPLPPPRTLLLLPEL